MSRLRVAVIGAGNIAQQHLPVLTNHPACEVAVLCDVNPAMLAETAGRFGIAEREESPDALLRRDDLDAVYVLVSVLHVARVASKFIVAGLPTFLEKPPGICSGRYRPPCRVGREARHGGDGWRQPALLQQQSGGACADGRAGAAGDDHGGGPRGPVAALPTRPAGQVHAARAAALGLCERHPRAGPAALFRRRRGGHSRYPLDPSLRVSR